MTIPASDARYVYEGEFSEGRRHGHGTMKREDAETELHFIYNGEWADDFISTEYPNNLAWSHLGKTIYCGVLTSEGDRVGYGILYKAEAMEDDEFRRCFLAETPAGRRYSPAGSSDLEKHKFKLYE